VSILNARDIEYDGPVGDAYFVCQFNVQQQSVVYCDTIGMMYNVLDGLDQMEAQPTDLIGTAPSFVVSSGGGAAPDLTPVVSAIEDLLLIDVDYTCNNGQNVISVRGKTRT
jgi:hypothetical protein